MSVVPTTSKQPSIVWAMYLTKLLLANLSLLLISSSREACASAEFPAILDPEDIAFFFEGDDMDGLHWALSHAFARSERNPIEDQIVHKLPDRLVSRGGGSTYTSAYKLKQDIEQAQYLVDHSEDQEEVELFRDTIIPIYQKVLDSIPPLEDLERTSGLFPFLAEDGDIRAVYNKALHHTNFGVLVDDEGDALPLLNDKLDLKQIERQWLGEDKDHGSPGIVVVDDILSQAALKRIRQLLLESTVWYQTKMPLRFGGYVGAYIDDGLHDKILLQLAFELHKALPRIMEGHPLKYLWAYKYDSDYTGINTHADEAAVNVNLWITPDDANLDPNSGGLVIFTTKPPDHWDFAEYNTQTERVVEELLKPTNFANVTVPHRQNRAILFDSALFHHTDKFKFKKGYENRRINLTILYGDMRKKASTGDEL